MEKREYEYVKLSEDSDDESYEMLAQGFCIVDENIYIPTMGDKGILQINMKKNEKNFIHYMRREMCIQYVLTEHVFGLRIQIII